MKLELVTHPNEILQTKITEEFDFDNPQYDASELRDSMLELMKKEVGIGLAANQCGINIRCFVFVNGMANNQTEADVLALNPSYEVMEDAETVDMFESCLSYPGVILSIPRPHKIKATWTNHKGKKFTEVLNGYSARCFIHECDHLDGVTMDQHVAPVVWKKAVADAEAKKT
jgi:peptide deformylase